MKLGKAFCKTETAPITIEVSRLNIETLKWSFFQSVDFAIEESELAEVVSDQSSKLLQCLQSF